MERKPARQQHDFHRYHRHRAPWHLREHCKRQPREDVCAGRASTQEYRRPRFAHVRRTTNITSQLERVVNLDRATDVRITTVIKRPAAMACLVAAQEGGELLLQ